MAQTLTTLLPVSTACPVLVGECRGADGIGRKTALRRSSEGLDVRREGADDGDLRLRRPARNRQQTCNCCARGQKLDPANG